MVLSTDIKKPETSPAKYRGTIIVDSNFFIHTHATIPEEWKNKDLPDHKQFYEILFFLAQNGFKILIPEETLYEVTRQFYHNKHLICVDNYFDNHTDPYHRDHTARSIDRRDYKSFFQRVASGAIPNIDILRSDELEGEAASFLRNIKAAVSRHHSSDRRRIAYDIAKITRHPPDDLADRVIKRHVQELSAQSPDMPFYVLSFDKPLLEDVYSQNKESTNVNVVGTVGFFKALKEQNILKHLGMRPDIDPLHIMVELFRQKNDKQFVYNGFIDRSCTAPHPENDRPFAVALKQLNKDLKAQNGHKQSLNGAEHAGGNGFANRVTGDTPGYGHPRINPSTPYTGRH